MQLVNILKTKLLRNILMNLKRPEITKRAVKTALRRAKVFSIVSM
jgi:hypothetical protein